MSPGAGTEAVQQLGGVQIPHHVLPASDEEDVFSEPIEEGGTGVARATDREGREVLGLSCPAVSHHCVEGRRVGGTSPRHYEGGPLSWLYPLHPTGVTAVSPVRQSQTDGDILLCPVCQVPAG